MAEIKDILTRLKNYIDQEDNNEQTRAENAEEALDAKIDQEISDRSDAVETEETRASNEETRIEGKLDDYISSNNQALADETAARAQADINEETRAKAEELRIETKLDGRIDTEIQDRKNDVDAEELRATTAETALNTRIDNLDVNLIGENGYYLKTIKQDDGKITATTEQIENEWGVLSHLRVPSSKLVKDTIDTEVTRATNKENALETRIGTEESTRASEITRLDTKIDNGSSTLDTKIETEKTRATNKENEIVATIQAMDLADTGIAGQYIRTVGQENGQITADPVSFDVDFNNPSNNNAPTTKAINDRFALISEAGTTFDLTLNQSNYKITLALKNRNGSTLKSETIDLPLESVVVSGRYDDDTRQVILTLQDGSTIAFSVADLIRGLQSEINEDNTLDSDLVDDTISSHKFVTAAEKAQITTNKNSIDAIKDGNLVDSFRDVEDELNKKVDKISGKGLSANDYTNEAVANVAANTSARHTHANKNLLDTYTQTEADLAAAVTNTHTHSNKAILDATTASFTAAYKNQLDTTAVSVDYDHTKFYKTLPTGQGSDIVSISTLKTDMSLNNVDNTSDADKPISTATQAALDLKENLANKTAVWVDDNNQSFVDDTHYPTTKLMYDTLETMNNNIEELIESATNILTIDVANVDVVEGYITAEEYSKINERTIIKFNYAGAPSALASHLCFHYSFQMLGLAKVFSCVGDDDFILFAVNISPETSGTYAGLYHWGKETSVSDLTHAVKDNQDNEFDHSHKNTFKGETEFQDIMTIKSEMNLTTDGYIKGGYISSSIPTVNYRATTQLDDIADAIWNAKKAYAVGDIIFYNRALYICELAVSASSAGNMDPATDTTHWTRLFTNQA